MCQLRRFQDGTIKETVTIKISSWGAYANDFILDKIVHLVSVHFDNAEAQVLRGNKKSFLLLILIDYNEFQWSVIKLCILCFKNYLL